MNKILKKEIWVDDEDSNEHEQNVSEEQKRLKKEVEEDERGIEMYDKTYISSDEDESDNENNDYNSANDDDVIHSKYKCRRNLRNNYNYYAKKSKSSRDEQGQREKRKRADTAAESSAQAIQYQ